MASLKFKAESNSLSTSHISQSNPTKYNNLNINTVVESNPTEYNQLNDNTIVLTSNDAVEYQQNSSSNMATQLIPQWYYVLEDKEKVGPVSYMDILELSVDTINAQTLFWCKGMDTWLPISHIPYFQSIFPMPKEIGQYSIVDLYRNIHRQISIEGIQKLFSEHKIDGRSLVWWPGESQWLPIEEVSSLSSLISSTPLYSKELESKEVEPSKPLKPIKQDKDKSKRKYVNPLDHFKEQTAVYVSGLPIDISIDELHQYFKKCGIIREDTDTGQPMIKIYTDDDGQVKGDARVTYLLGPSVSLAIDILHETEIRPGYLINIEPARWEKGKKKKKDINEKNKKKKRDPKSIEIMKKKLQDQLKQVSWSEGIEEEGKGFRIVILKKMFDLNNPHDEIFFENLRREVGEEIEKICGSIEKLTIFENNPEGVIAIKFKSPSSAEKCIRVFHGRYYSKQQISCEYFDGYTNYGKESEEEQEERLKRFGEWLEKGND